MKSKEMTPNEQKLTAFVMDHIQKWRDHREINYDDDWMEYERLWLGIWSSDDKTRETERSRVITPAIQQAIESFQSEIEEATFGKGTFFDINDDFQDKDKADVELLKRQLKEDCDRHAFKAAISEIILNMSVYGTGVGELIVKKEKRLKPATRPLPLPGMEAVGTEELDYFCVKLHPVHPRNFVIDPSATEIKEGMGCAVDELVPAYQVVQDMEQGIYEKRNIGLDYDDDDLVQEEVSDEDKSIIRLVRYYGLVPKELLENKEGEFVELFHDTTDVFETYKELVEAVIVIANDSVLLKAEETPYMMQDRPVIAAKCDIRPGRFWGRGISEKGYNMQKVIDAQVRSHLDSVALTAVPMMGIDATRMPRGFKFNVSPGRSILTNGNPAETLMPLMFGQQSMLNVETANLFERYLLQATGTIDSSAMPQNAVNGADPEAMGAALSSIIKRHRRTMTQFQENFIVPLVEKTAWRYMQFDPNRYPVKDFKFIPSGTLGIIAREYEQRQYLGMMSTLGPESPLVPILMRGILQNSSLSNREELIAEIEKASKPDPAQQQAQMQMQQMQMQLLQLQLQELQTKNAKTMAEAQYTQIKAQLEPRKVESQLIASLTKNSEESDEFGRRVKIAELALAEADINEKAKDRSSNEKIIQLQTAAQLEQAKMSSEGKNPRVDEMMSKIDDLNDLINAETETEVVRDDKGKIAKTIKRRKTSKGVVESETEVVRGVDGRASKTVKRTK